MTNKVKFTKMHGAGNDYLYVNTLLYSVPDPQVASIAWSDRHTGVGSDGLVLIGAPQDSSAADFSMRIFNADGSEAMMCGNASRCIGKYLYEKEICRKEEIRLETRSGVKMLKLHFDDAGDRQTVCAVTVDMLAPQFDELSQFTGRKPAHDVPGCIATCFVSIGNPHYVLFVESLAGLDISQYGHILEHSESFPERCNIEFAQIRMDGGIRTRVWERGSGITMACGTGACATAVAASTLGLAARDTDIIMDGGTLHIHWDEGNEHIYMTGPAAFICDGEIQLP